MSGASPYALFMEAEQSNPERGLRKALAAAMLACGAATVMHLVVAAGGKPGAALLGLWLAHPALAVGGAQLWLARRAVAAPVGRARLAGLFGGALAVVAILVASQAIVSTNKGSTAALLYLFAPLYAWVLGGVAWLACWGAAAGLLRLGRQPPQV